MGVQIANQLTAVYFQLTVGLHQLTADEAESILLMEDINQ